MKKVFHLVVNYLVLLNNYVANFSVNKVYNRHYVSSRIDENIGSYNVPILVVMNLFVSAPTLIFTVLGDLQINYLISFAFS